MKFLNLLRSGLLALALSVSSLAANAGAMSDFLETALINHLMRGTAYTAPTNMYVALATSSGSESACGTEVSGGSYARVAVAAGTGSWAATSSGNGTTSNVSVITFPTPTANWGTVIEFCVFDASSAGNMLFRAALTTPKTINSGDAAPSFAAGALTFQIDN